MSGELKQTTQLPSVLKTFLLFGIQVMAIWLTDQLMRSVTIVSLWHSVVLAAVIGLLNRYIKPFLIILTIPVTFLTLGIFLLVINGIIIVLASEIVPGFEVDGFGSAILFSLILSLTNWTLESLFGLRRLKITVSKF